MPKIHKIKRILIRIKRTLKQTYSQDFPRVPLAFKNSMTHEFCKSHYLSQFATFFIDVGAKTSPATGCMSDYEVFTQHNICIRTSRFTFTTLATRTPHAKLTTHSTFDFALTHACTCKCGKREQLTTVRQCVDRLKLQVRKTRYPTWVLLHPIPLKQQQSIHTTSSYALHTLTTQTHAHTQALLSISHMPCTDAQSLSNQRLQSTKPNERLLPSVTKLLKTTH